MYIYNYYNIIIIYNNKEIILINLLVQMGV